MRRLRSALLVLSLAAVASSSSLPSPKEFFGFDVCQDYHLANYQQYAKYLEALDKGSDRIKVVSMGSSEGGRPQLMAIISDPGNLRNVERHRQTSERFAKAREFKSEADAIKAASKAKAVVWIDGGLHANETLGAQQLIETAWQLVSRNDEENKRILRDCVILLVHANPDGMDLVSDWFMRKPKPEDRSLAGIPELYQKYAGHDNNRDFYANNLAETRNMNRVLYQQWFPQIVYNHHQTSPAGTIMFIPPFRNPFNYHVHPLVQISTDLVGVHMHQRLIGEGKKGTVMRNGASFSAWWNGGLRTTTYFHNMVGILTETYGSPSGGEVGFIKNRQIPSIDLPNPVDAGPWKFRQSLDYSVSANYAILDYASRYREKLLLNFWRAGRDAIERGSRDHWTRYPNRIEALGADSLSKPEFRDARMYVMPADQPDQGSLNWFIERLQYGGIEIHSTTEATTINGRSVPAGSFVVRCDQSFLPHILDMFEPQDYPNEFQFPGGPPIAPYDNAGYTPAYQMGIDFVRVLDPVELKLERVAESPRRMIDKPDLSKDLTLDLRDLDSFRMAFHHLKGGRGWKVEGNQIRISGSGVQAPRVALWDRFGGSMESGWTRFVLETMGVNYDVLFAPDLDSPSWKDKYDILLLPAGAIPARDPEAIPNAALATDPTVDAKWRARIGAVTISKTVPQIKAFVESGGHVVAIGSSSLNLARALELPLESALTEVDQGRTRPLPSSKFFVPGSVMRMALKPGPLTAGLGAEVDTMFDESPAFRLTTPTSGVETIAWFSSDKPLRSGWAWGQELLKDTLAVVDVPVGKGRVVLSGPELLFRGQPTQTMKIVMNAILRSGE